MNNTLLFQNKVKTLEIFFQGKKISFHMISKSAGLFKGIRNIRK